MKRKKFAFVVVSFLGILLVYPLLSMASPRGELKATIHWAISADWLDPSTAGFPTAGNFTMYLFHDALVKPMPEGLFTPCLAESWTVSPDFRVYEFKLRRGVKFHNGDPLTADDVVFSFWRYKASQAKFLQSKAEKVEAVNPYLVRYTFKEPFLDFLDYFLPGASTIGWIVPKKYVEKVGDAGYKKHPIGCGPYKFVEFVPGVKLVAEAFEGYWRKVPNIKRMEFPFIMEPATRLAMLKRGEMDIATQLTDVFYEDAKKDKNFRVLNPLSPTRFLVYMASQWDSKSPWSDVRVRKAASLAIDRKTLADVHMPGAGPIGSLGLTGDPLAVQFPPDPYDPAMAKKLLAEAGYPNGFHGGKFYPYDGPYRAFGEQVATYLRSIGIRLDSVILERPAWMANRTSGKMRGAVFTDLSVAPTIAGRLSYLFGSSSLGNYPDIQTLWDRFQSSHSPKMRKDLIAQVQKLIYEKRMYIPLTSTTTPAALSPKVKGNPIKIQPLIWFIAPLEDVEIVN